MRSSFLLILIPFLSSCIEGVPPRLFSVNVDTDPSRRRGGGEEEGREAGFPMADALGIHKRGLSALSSSEESVVPPSLGPGWAFSKDEESTDRPDDNWQKVGGGRSETPAMNLMMKVLKDGGILTYGKGNAEKNGWSLLEMKATVLKPLLNGGSIIEN